MVKKIVFCLLCFVPMMQGMDFLKETKKHDKQINKSQDKDKIKIEHLDDVKKLHDYQKEFRGGKHKIFAEEHNREIDHTKK
jgi:hypothetical protein